MSAGAQPEDVHASAHELDPKGGSESVTQGSWHRSKVKPQWIKVCALGGLGIFDGEYQ